jgi:hypothetical protein
MFRFLRSKEPKKLKKAPINIVAAIQKHKTRIGNLEEELEICVVNLKALHSDSEVPTSVINKEASTIITRMTFIKYELEIRGDLIKWL